MAPRRNPQVAAAWWHVSVSVDQTQAAVFPGSGGAVYASSFTSMAMVGCNFTRNQVLAGCPHCLSHKLPQKWQCTARLIVSLSQQLLSCGCTPPDVQHTLEDAKRLSRVMGSFGWLRHGFGVHVACHVALHHRTAVCLATEAPGVQPSNVVSQAAVTNAASGAQGGALALSTGNLATLDSCDFSGNTAGQSGGALAVLGCAESDATAILLSLWTRPVVCGLRSNAKPSQPKA